MRFPAVRLLLPVFLAALSACSDQKKTTQVEQANRRPVVADTTSAPTPPATPAAPKATPEQDIAAYLAGMPVSASSELQLLTAQPAWQAFSADANKSWNKYDSTRTVKIERWAAKELDSVRAASPTVFYPFSGPDFLNVTTMFPGSSRYILIGLEPVGALPPQTTLQNPKLFPALKASLWSVLNFSFFRTNDMAVDLNGKKTDSTWIAKRKQQMGVKPAKEVTIDGVLPLLMLFAARTDHQVTAVRYIQLNAEGQALEADTATIRKPGLKEVPGVEVTLKAKDGQEKSVVYFSADLSDWKLGVTKEAVLKYVRTLGPLTTYVKSATYLMHKSYFSKVRNLVLDRSNFILQDDSGIAMKYFPASNWQFTYYGTYKRPINLFAKQYQPALTAAYTDSANPPRPLPFGTGYNWRQTDSNLLLARRTKLLAE
ncbi:hypothetical protein HMJ29_09880 [Hymenobacter taeanensis]|uniref:Lipoprotein n=1 Tax=Hymenobacter taeanensis TaxID=2735321 RepID=A0A6M6BGS5_9BACT|nr:MULTISPECIES: hypothetical protein [Hymenobacter]QJX47229.1 hypothetical protein HMJ29_09880 [Hymenobacter taeanensis]UOQ81148.1 hypothetical protein MUN83_20450 [Hymenobacter sp. 5414T-23]